MEAPKRAETLANSQRVPSDFNDLITLQTTNKQNKIIPPHDSKGNKVNIP